MKELSIEEKAKRYDEAIEKFDVILNLDIVKESGTIFADDVRKILPELKSEDEKIRKALVEMVHDTTGDELWVDYNVHKEEALAWLEKQGEQKPAEWSEEDKKMFVNIKACLRNANKDYSAELDWLKSLKDRCTWKPSDKQINALSDVLSIKEIKYDVLSELLKCLKKLI